MGYFLPSKISDLAYSIETLVKWVNIIFWTFNSQYCFKLLNISCPMWAATISRHPPARCLGFYYFCNLMPCPKCTRFYTKAPAGLWIDCLLQLLKSSSHFSTIDYAEWCARTQPFKVALALPNRFLSLINISKIALIFFFYLHFL